MTNYRKILKLHMQEISQRDIAASCECPKTTVNSVIAKAKENKHTLHSGP